MSRAHAWKSFGRGLMATRDETKVIGTFHVDRRHPQKGHIGAVVLNAEALEVSLRRLMQVMRDNTVSPEYRAIVEREAQELLDELDKSQSGRPS